MDVVIARCEREIENLKAELKNIGSLNRRWFLQEQIDWNKKIIEQLKEEQKKCTCKKAVPAMVEPKLTDKEDVFRGIVPKKVCDGNSCTFVYEEDK